MDEQDGALPPAEDRATHEPSQQAVSAVPVGIPSAEWTAWAGGECPVDLGAPIDIRWNNGAISRGATARFYAEGEIDFWKSRDRGGHIVAYRAAVAREDEAPSPAYGKYGLPEIDEIAIDTLASCLERMWASKGRGALYIVPVERKRLRHALAAYLIRAITPRDQFWNDIEAAAQAIEARRAETGTGSVGDESAVPKGCAQ